MFIRRIAENINSKNWSTVVIELIVVVVGVFFGIQVSNWNDDRLDTARAESYLVRIHADLAADVTNYRDRMRFWSDVAEYGQQGLLFAESGDKQALSDWDLVLAYFQASQLAEFYTVQATYDELKSGGELGLIEDLSLRNMLADYYTNEDNPTLTERPAYREHIRGIVPLSLQNYIWDNCYSASPRGIQEMTRCDSPSDASNLSKTLERISADDTLMAELRYWMSTMHVAAIIGRSRTAYAERVMETVELLSGSDVVDEVP